MNQVKCTDTAAFDATANMRPKAAARYLGLSESKLAKLRMSDNRADGPRFIKLAGCVVYRRVDLDAWMSAHVVDR